LRAEFFEMGYRLFLDRDTLKSKFIEADITDANSALSGLDGKIDIISSITKGRLKFASGW
jgi:hypothetical protein